MRTPTLSLVILLASALSAADMQDRWIYFQNNLWVDKNIEKLEDLMRRGAKAGYTGVMIADSKMSKLQDMNARYFKNVDRVKALAKELNLEIIPCVFSLGYSSDILWHDQNLVEAMPVKDAPFIVKDGAARLAPDVRELKKASWKDETVTQDETGWKIENPNGKNARLVFKLKVQPFRQYHFTARVKTQDLHAKPEVKALAGSTDLLSTILHVKPTQDWTPIHGVFNSLENTEVGIYFGCWGGKTGTLWISDPKFEEVGLINLVRREGAPLVIKNKDGEVLAEGKDYERVVDPLMGAHPWKGSYDNYHEPPVIKTPLPDGTQLSVSYHHAIIVLEQQVMICPSEPKTLALLKDQAKRVHAAWGANKYMMSFDEIRAFNWCDACQKRKLDAGPMLAEIAKECTNLLREVNPGGKIYVWNDMFDPHHNARKNYYLSRGDFTGSWEGIDKDVVIVAWYFEARDKTFEFFKNRGNPLLIAGYYDGGQDTRKWLESAKKAGGVQGIMYTTWESKFGELENFAATVKEMFP